MANDRDKPKVTPEQFKEMTSKLPSKFERQNFDLGKSVKDLEGSIKDARSERIARVDPHRQREIRSADAYP